MSNSPGDFFYENPEIKGGETTVLIDAQTRSLQYQLRLRPRIDAGISRIYAAAQFFIANSHVIRKTRTVALILCCSGL